MSIIPKRGATLTLQSEHDFVEEQQQPNKQRSTQEQNGLEQEERGDMMMSSNNNWLKRMFYLCVFIFVLFPLLSIFLATIFGGLLAWAENTTFLNGFLYVVSNLLGMANPLTNWEPTTGTGVVIVIDIYTAVAALISFGIMLNVVNLFRVPHEMNNLIRKVVTNGFLVPTIALGIIIPAWYAGLCSIMGAILALAENWHVSEGILYVLSNILGLANPLTDVSPNKTAGQVIDVVISSIALGYIAIFADYVTTLNPSSYVRFKIRGYLIALGVVDADSTAIAHPLRQLSITNDGEYDDKEAEREGIETKHSKSLLIGSFPVMSTDVSRG
mmetsp:Transcript_15634/g.26373  ORF Transcript_15634/g.26373 Transcript_15634/m.26373 type:complete len:328 (-) Transcript_15634:453-1436(-)